MVDCVAVAIGTMSEYAQKWIVLDYAGGDGRYESELDVVARFLAADRAYNPGKQQSSEPGKYPNDAPLLVLAKKEPSSVPASEPVQAKAPATLPTANIRSSATTPSAARDQGHADVLAVIDDLQIDGIIYADVR